jgi:hypothetical protein
MELKFSSWSSYFPLYSLNFIQGDGQIDGVNPKTLWANLNKVVSSTSTMSQTHHWEVLDNYMNNSN